VPTVCIDQAASMGSLLLAAGASGQRYSLPNWAPELGGRRFIAGANWTVGLGNPFRSFGEASEGLEHVLADQRANSNRPIIYLVHLVHPRLKYTDRLGRSAGSRARRSRGRKPNSRRPRASMRPVGESRRN
jgi:hypothetical protein